MTEESDECQVYRSCIGIAFISEEMIKNKTLPKCFGLQKTHPVPLDVVPIQPDMIDGKVPSDDSNVLEMYCIGRTVALSGKSLSIQCTPGIKMMAIEPNVSCAQCFSKVSRKQSKIHSRNLRKSLKSVKCKILRFPGVSNCKTSSRSKHSNKSLLDRKCPSSFLNASRILGNYKRLQYL
jgi:hypothetical protein